MNTMQGHSNIPGEEMADEAAKEAANMERVHNAFNMETEYLVAIYMRKDQVTLAQLWSGKH